jgi:hypothetical protein
LELPPDPSERLPPEERDQVVVEQYLAAWLWSGRRGIIAGRAAAVLHGVVGPFNHPAPASSFAANESPLRISSKCADYL